MTVAQILFSVALTIVTLAVGAVAVRAVSSTFAARRPYRGHSGQWAFVANRVSGVLVFAFLLLHILDVSLVRWPHLYDEVHELYGNVLMRLFEVGLLFALLFHSFNGVRVALVDLFPGVLRNHQRLLAGVVVATVLIGAPGGYVILKPFIDGRFR